MALAQKPEPANSNARPANVMVIGVEHHVDNIWNAFLQDCNNVDELMVSMDELIGTPGSGVILVRRNVGRIADCPAEQDAISELLVLLFKKGKLSKDDVCHGLAEAVESIDKGNYTAYDHVAHVLGALVEVDAVDVEWLIDQTQKPNSGFASVLHFTPYAIAARLQGSG